MFCLKRDNGTFFCQEWPLVSFWGHRQDDPEVYRFKTESAAHKIASILFRYRGFKVTVEKITP